MEIADLEDGSLCQRVSDDVVPILFKKSKMSHIEHIFKSNKSMTGYLTTPILLYTFC